MIEFDKWGARCDTEEEAQSLVRERGGCYFSQRSLNRAVIWATVINLVIGISAILFLMSIDPALRGH